MAFSIWLLSVTFSSMRSTWSLYFSATSFKLSFPKAVAATRSPLPNATSVIFRPSPLELPVINHTFFIFLCLLIVLQIYWRYRPTALLKSSIYFVIQLKEKFNGWLLALIKQKMVYKKLVGKITE